MPFADEHAARVADPGEFIKSSFRRKNIAPGVSIIVAKKVEDGPMETTSYRFDANKFSPAAAKAWLSKNKVKSSFISATGQKEMEELAGVSSGAGGLFLPGFIGQDKNKKLGESEMAWKVSGAKDLPLADADRPWDGAAAEKRVLTWAGGKDNTDFHKYSKAFCVCDSSAPELLGSYKLPFADVINGKLTAVPRGIMAAGNVMRGARHSPIIPGAVEGVKSFLAGYYKKMDHPAPWEAKKEMSENASELLWYGLSYPIEPESQPGPGVTISSIEIARVGSWDHPVYGKFDFTVDRFNKFIEGFDNNVRRQELPLDVEHKPENGAAAWFVPGTMRVENNSLWVDVDWTDKGNRLVDSNEYKYNSITFRPEWKDPETSQVFNDVIFGAALTCEPFIKGMSTVQEARPGCVRLSEFDIREGELQMANTKFKQSKGALKSSKEEALKNKLESDGDLEGRKDLPEDTSTPTVCKEPAKKDDEDEEDDLCGYSEGDDSSGDSAEEDDVAEPDADDEEDTTEKKKKKKVITIVNAAEKKKLSDKAEMYDEGGADQMYDEGALDTMSADKLAEHFEKVGKKLAEKVKGVKGSPMIRQHIKATHELTKPVLERLAATKCAEEDQKMSENATANDPAVLKLTENYRRLAERTEVQEKELSELRTERRRTQAVSLTEKLFPRQGFDTFRLPETARQQVNSLLIHLSAQEGDAGMIKLSEEKSVNAADELLAILNAIPETKINGKSHIALSATDSEHDDSGADSRLHRLAEAYSKENKVSYAQAALEVAKNFQ